MDPNTSQLTEHAIVDPGYIILPGTYIPPGDGGHRPLPLVENNLVVPQPPLLVEQQLAGRAPRHERLVLPGKGRKDPPSAGRRREYKKERKENSDDRSQCLLSSAPRRKKSRPCKRSTKTNL